MTRITGLRTYDLRFPTARHRDGSDAMNPDPDYSAAYLVIETAGGREGHALTFTIGRGNEICVAAIEAVGARVTGLDLDWIREDMGRFWRHVTGDSQLRWLGPDKGVIHLAAGAVINAVWDLWARDAGKPVWRLVAEMTPADVLRLIDFRYLTDTLTPDEALQLLAAAEPGKRSRIAELEASGYPCYTTSVGWLGYADHQLSALCASARKAGFTHAKFKVGRSIEEDVRRLTIAREQLGETAQIMIDANQVWEVDEAITWIKELAFARPHFVEEPTSPDDVTGHRRIREAVAPIKVASGEMCQNRILFKQFIAGGAIDIVQLDCCRLGGLNEVLAVMLLAAKFGRPVWPHAGGVGLCEYAQHLSMIDYAVISGRLTDRRIEYVDHLHEHFVDPCLVEDGAYRAPHCPGFSIEMKATTLRDYQFGHTKPDLQCGRRNR